MRVGAGESTAALGTRAYGARSRSIQIRNRPPPRSYKQLLRIDKRALEIWVEVDVHAARGWGWGNICGSKWEFREDALQCEGEGFLIGNELVIKSFLASCVSPFKRGCGKSELLPSAAPIH